MVTDKLVLEILWATEVFSKCPYSVGVHTAGQMIQGSGDSRTKTLPDSGIKQLMQAGDGA